MAAEPCSEHAEGDMSKADVKKDKKKKKREGKKREEEAETRGQMQKLDAAVENLVAEGDGVERKQSSKSKKSKRKRKRNDAGEASAGDEVVTREGKKRKKEHPVALEETDQKQAFDTAVENLVVERDKVEGKPSRKSKKSKHEHNDAGEASGRDQVVTREDKKRKKKKVGNKSSPEFSENASAGGEEADVDGKNDMKKNKSKEGTGEGIKEKEKAARSKKKGKRVSFADSTEVFRIEGGDGEEKEGGKKKKKNATKSKNKDKHVRFADSAEDGEGGSSDKSKFVHGKRFTPEEDATLMEAIRDFMEMKQLGEEGLEMLRSRSRTKPPELKDCWTEIGKSLPHRPRTAIYMRAHILLSRSNERKWTQEEKEYIRRFVEKNGTDWKTLGRELGKCNIHVKDTWRRTKSEL